METLQVQNVLTQYKTLIKSLEENEFIVFGGTYDKYYDIFVDVLINGNLAEFPNDENKDHLQNVQCEQNTSCTSNTNIGIRYDLTGVYYGWIVKDYEKAIKMWLKSIEFGVIHAMNNLGLHYSMIEPNTILAEYYFGLAIGKGHVKSMFNLGIHYAQIKEYWQQAEYYLKMALDHGYMRASSVLASHYHMDVHNYELALYYYKMSIGNGDREALNNLGVYYATVEYNYELAIKYFIAGGKYKMVACFENMLIFVENVYCYDMLFEIFKSIITNGEERFINLLLEKEIDGFNKWKVLNKLIEESDIVIKTKDLLLNAMNSLENGIIYGEQIRDFKGKLSDVQKIDICPLCLECDTLIINIGLGCGHGVCYGCYRPFDKCFYRCVLNKNTIL